MLVFVVLLSSQSGIKRILASDREVVKRERERERESRFEKA
jgi:hypothetical protein